MFGRLTSRRFRPDGISAHAGIAFDHADIEEIHQIVADFHLIVFFVDPPQGLAVGATAFEFVDQSTGGTG